VIGQIGGRNCASKKAGGAVRWAEGIPETMRLAASGEAKSSVVAERTPSGACWRQVHPPGRREERGDDENRNFFYRARRGMRVREPGDRNEI
jgi:hypothetical protein